jgi:hypothetical protein
LNVYAVITAFLAFKYFADPWFSDGSCIVTKRSIWNPSLFLYQIDNVATPLLNGSTKLRGTCGALLIGGSVGALALPWMVPYSLVAYLCLGLILLSVFYYVTIIPYYALTEQVRLLGRPMAMLVVGGLATVGHLWNTWATIDADSITPYHNYYTSSIILIAIVLILTVVSLVATMWARKDKCATSIEKFHLVRNHFLENTQLWATDAEYPAGFSESRLLLSV